LISDEMAAMVYSILYNNTPQREIAVVRLTVRSFCFFYSPPLPLYPPPPREEQYQKSMFMVVIAIDR
jgi:hypothetical protein